MGSYVSAFKMMLTHLSKRIIQVGVVSSLTGIAAHQSNNLPKLPSIFRSFSVMAQGSDPTKASSIFEFTAKDIDGNNVSLDKYKGHVCVIVNVASK